MYKYHATLYYSVCLLYMSKTFCVTYSILNLFTKLQVQNTTHSGIILKLYGIYLA